MGLHNELESHEIFRIVDACNTCCKYKDTLRSNLYDILDEMSDYELSYVSQWLIPRVKAVTKTLYSCDISDLVKAETLYWFNHIMSGHSFGKENSNGNK